MMQCYNMLNHRRGPFTKVQLLLAQNSEATQTPSCLCSSCWPSDWRSAFTSLWAPCRRHRTRFHLRPRRQSSPSGRSAWTPGTPSPPPSHCRRQTQQQTSWWHVAEIQTSHFSFATRRILLTWANVVKGTAIKWWLHFLSMKTFSNHLFGFKLDVSRWTSRSHQCVHASLGPTTWKSREVDRLLPVHVHNVSGRGLAADPHSGVRK